jgi:hypothetical protein
MCFELKRGNRIGKLLGREQSDENNKAKGPE